MHRRASDLGVARGVVLALMLLFVASLALPGAAAAQEKSSMEIYGHVMLDMGFQFKQNDPDWYDVVRPTKLPQYEDEFGKDGRWFMGVRQTRLGVKTVTPTELGDLKTQFEFELFGVGADAGQTTFRLRHAYGELGKIGAGQTWSPFMDIDVFPNSLEYWGPSGMAFFRNVQFRYMPIQGDSRMTIAIEKPGASGDAGSYAGAEELQGVQARYPLPDLSAEYRMGRGWGYVELAGILRKIQWDDLEAGGGTDLSDSKLGWGLNLSSNIKTGTSGTIRLQALYGEGVENYMNDATVDVAVEENPGDPTKPFVGKVLPVLGLVGFYDHTWSPKWSSTLGYSMISIDNTQAQLDGTFHTGHYALINLLHYPVKNVMIGGEVQYGRRENFFTDDASDGIREFYKARDDIRVQFSAKYNFSLNL
jgi:hypothetical protein